MCELFGVNSARPVRTNDLLQDFFTHCCDHPQGWGIALCDHGVSIEKEPKKASTSAYLKERMNSSILARNLLAHIRLATIGNMEYDNTHPFVGYDISGRTWTQIHNGTLFEAPDVDPYFYRERGSTDSERMLLYFLDRVEEATLKAGHPLNADERTTLVEKTLAHLTPHNIHVCEDGRSAWFSTLPLRHGNWEPLPMNRLLVYKNGQRIYEGASHGHEYIDNPEDLRFLENFAML